MDGMKIVRDGFGIAWEVPKDLDWDNMSCDEQDAYIILEDPKRVEE